MHISQLFAERHHPVVVAPGHDGAGRAMRHVLSDKAGQLAQLLHVHGAVLLRGFGIDSLPALSAALDSLGASPNKYAGGNSPRTQVAEDIYTSTEFPASTEISLHHEMSYLAQWPKRLFFYAEQPAEAGGQTSLACSRDVTAAIDAGVFDTFRIRGLVYLRHFHPRAMFGKTWQETYGTRDREEALAVLAAQGATGTWLPGDVLQVSNACAATVPDPANGRPLWFNQAEQWHPSALNPEVRAMFARSYGNERFPHDCRYGDGSPIEEEALRHVRDVLARHKLLFDWRRGDLLMVDNVLMMHGREPFRGKRRTLAYLSAS